MSLLFKLIIVPYPLSFLYISYEHYIPYPSSFFKSYECYIPYPSSFYFFFFNLINVTFRDPRLFELLIIVTFRIPLLFSKSYLSLRSLSLAGLRWTEPNGRAGRRNSEDDEYSEMRRQGQGRVRFGRAQEEIRAPRYVLSREEREWMWLLIPCLSVFLIGLSVYSNGCVYCLLVLILFIDLFICSFVYKAELDGLFIYL